MSEFYFAWCDEGETFGAEHQVYDENVFSFTVDHREGEIPTLTIVIRNPRIGLLNAGRKLWCWLSHLADDTSGVTPIFNGRLVGIPQNVFQELVTLVFVAKPSDYAAQRRTLALSMAVLPMYDPVFVDPDLRITETGGDPDVVLEGWPARWHVSRGEDGAAPTVTASDIIIGEDGTEAFSDGVPFDSVSLTISDTPVTSIDVKAGVNWTQTVQGPSIDLGGFTLATFTGQSLVSSWPKPGAGIGGGWAAADGTYAVDLFDAAGSTTQTTTVNWQNRSKQHTTGDTMSLNISATYPVVRGGYISQKLTEHQIPGVVWVPGGFARPTDPTADYQQTVSTTDWVTAVGEGSEDDDIINIPMHYDATWITVAESLVETHLNITYELGRNRQEHCNFVMTSDIQPVLTLPGDFDTPGNPPDTEILEINGVDVSVPIDGVAPLTDKSQNAFFPTDRGIQAIEYLLMRARARLLAGARIVQISWACNFERVLSLTCRKNASLTWEKLPGGIASGKIIAYTIFADGNTGRLGGTVTIGATIGHGGSVTTAAGEADWVETDYVQDDYQYFIGEVVASDSGDVAYSPPVYSVNPEAALPLTKADVVISETVHGSVETQVGILFGALPQAYTPGNLNNEQQLRVSQYAANAAQQALDDNAVWIEYVLKPVNDLALVDGHDLNIEPLVIPKTIDLEAASNA